VKILCKVGAELAMITGYCPDKHGRPQAVVVCAGKLKAVRLRDVELLNVPPELERKTKPKLQAVPKT
jgi:hypothetical protein